MPVFNRVAQIFGVVRVVLLPQVVDKVNDDAWGLSATLPVGVAATSSGTDGSTAATKLGLVIGLCAGGKKCSFSVLCTQVFDIFCFAVRFQVPGVMSRDVPIALVSGKNELSLLQGVALV